MDIDPPTSEDCLRSEGVGVPTSEGVGFPTNKGVGVPTSEGVPLSEDVLTSVVKPPFEGVPVPEAETDFTGFTKEDIFGNEPSPLSDQPKTSRRKCGRPRKVAAEGEVKRRNQMMRRREAKIASNSQAISKSLDYLKNNKRRKS